MTFTFRKALREQTSTLIALAGPSGCGKTFSALRLATGLAGPGGKIAVIDTEAGRALHYADKFAFDHGDLHPPFKPQAYLDAILAAEKAGYAVVVIDSMSHEYEGEGGILEWADEIAAGGVKSPGNWKLPKTAHKKMVNRLLQMRCHLIFCLRAEEKIKIEKHPDTGKTVIVPLGWMPICEKRFMYEMTTSFTLTADKPGCPQYTLPHKCQDQHRAIFPEGRPIDERAGEQLAAWARGGVKPEPKAAAEPTGAAAATHIVAPSQVEDDFTAAIDGAGTLEELQRVDADIRASSGKLDAAARGRLYERRTKRKAALTQQAAA